MNKIKQQALTAVKSMSENATLEDAMYRLYVLDKINKGQEAILQNKVLTVTQLRSEISKW